MSVLEKIKAEITEKISHYEHFSSSNTAHGLQMALDIIDKYASEECDNDCEHCAYLECPKDDYQTDMDEAWEQAKQEEYDKAYDDYLALVNAEQGMKIMRTEEVKRAIDYLLGIWGDYGRHKRAVEVLIAYIENLEAEQEPTFPCDVVESTKIKAMQELINESYCNGFMDGKEEGLRETEQEPCEDAVSRQAVLEYFESRYPKNYADEPELGGASCAFSLNCIRKALDELPSVRPQEPKTGRWDKSCRCSECKEWSILESEKLSGKYKFCPNCGAYMVKPQESEDKE